VCARSAAEPNGPGRPVGVARKISPLPAGPRQLGQITSPAMITPVVAARIRAAAEMARRSRTAAGARTGRIQRRGTSRRAGHRRHASATISSTSCVSIAALTRLRIASRYGRARGATRRASRHPSAWRTTDPSRRPPSGGNTGGLGVGSGSMARRRSFTSQLYRAARISNNISAAASGNPRRIVRRPAMWRSVADSAAAASGAGSGSNSPGSQRRTGRTVMVSRVEDELRSVCTIAARPRL
jgi:hypothetical protein